MSGSHNYKVVIHTCLCNDGHFDGESKECESSVRYRQSRSVSSVLRDLETEGIDRRTWRWRRYEDGLIVSSKSFDRRSTLYRRRWLVGKRCLAVDGDLGMCDLGRQREHAAPESEIAHGVGSYVRKISRRMV